MATGPGWVAAQAAERGASVVGVDVADAMLARAQSAHPGLEFRWADAHELPFAGASFDAVVGNLVVMHLSRPERAMAEFVRVLRPGGRLALTAWADPSQHRLAGVFLDAVKEAGATPPEDLPPGPDFFRFSDDEAFAAALLQQGLASPAVSSITFVLRFASADELWNSMLGATVRVSALITRQPEEVRQRIRAAFDRLADGYRRGDGLELPVAVKLATAQKPDPSVRLRFGHDRCAHRPPLPYELYSHDERPVICLADDHHTPAWLFEAACCRSGWAAAQSAI